MLLMMQTEKFKRLQLWIIYLLHGGAEEEIQLWHLEIIWSRQVMIKLYLKLLKYKSLLPDNHLNTTLLWPDCLNALYPARLVFYLNLVVAYY